MSMSTGHEARHFHEELGRLRNQLLDMASMAEDLLRLSVEAFLENDPAKADSVILGDRELDAMEVEMDEACINLLALHQPFAKDLRLVTMIMRISNDLERVGDHSVNIAETVQHLESRPPLDRFPQLEEMARIAREMLSDALDSFVRGDSVEARKVCRRDDRVDALHDSTFRSLLTHMMEDPRRIGPSMSLILVSRNLERVADLATNVAEDVVFLVEGRSIKHSGGRSHS
jgi:phosphate transport system protein